MGADGQVYEYTSHTNTHISSLDGIYIVYYTKLPKLACNTVPHFTFMYYADGTLGQENQEDTFLYIYIITHLV